MAGKICVGSATNNSGASNLRSSKAFCEGLNWRAQGTAAAYPITDNPFDGDGSEAEAAWDAGWTVANGAAGGTITASDAPCCAVTAATISA